jgi:hypothetical protein
MFVQTVVEVLQFICDLTELPHHTHHRFSTWSWNVYNPIFIPKFITVLSISEIFYVSMSSSDPDGPEFDASQDLFDDLENIEKVIYKLYLFQDRLILTWS